MKRKMQFLLLRFVIAIVGLLLLVTSTATWRLENLRSRLQTRLANLKADAPR